MLARLRRERILEELRLRAAIRSAEVAESLGVSEMTVRRDIEALSEAGLVRKVHGGAERASELSLTEPSFATKVPLFAREKYAIAQRALAQVRPGMTLGLGAGTTVAALSALLTTVADLRIVTNSLPVAHALYGSNPAKDVILVGGSATPSDALVGPLAEANLATLHTDLCLLGTHAIDQAGLSTPNLYEAATNAAFIRNTDRVVVLADHSKFDTRAFAQFAQLDDVDTIITSEALSAKQRSSYSSIRAFELAPTTPEDS